MKNPFAFAVTTLLISLNLSAQNPAPQKEGSVFSIEVGNMAFSVDSLYGAKVSSLTLEGDEFMVTSDMVSTDYLWGATLWPSPQREWNWNNPYKLVWDNEEYTSFIEGDTMRFTGKKVAVDNGDSFYFTKSFWANAADTSISLFYTMENASARVIRKALWELTRVPVGGLTFWPTGPGGTWGDLASATDEVNDHTWYLREDEDGSQLKFFADGKDGWFAHVDDLYRLYIKTFEDVEQKDFARDEGEIELWVDHEYIELENQSTCVNIPVNGSHQYQVRWYLRMLPDTIVPFVGNMELVQYVKSIIEEEGQNPTSISRNPAENFFIYPVPAKNTLHIHSERADQQLIRYEILNLVGEIIQQGESTTRTLDISGISQGMYIIRVTCSDTAVSQKLLIQ